MEMMDIKAAIKLFNDYVSVLELKQTLLQEVRKLAEGDPELTEHVTSQTECLRTSFRAYAIFSIMFSERLIKQSLLVILHDDFADLMAAKNRFDGKLNEVGQFLANVEQKGSPKPSAATSSDKQAAGPIDLT